MLKENASQLTEYEKKRLNRQRVCPICGTEIRDYNSFYMFKRRDRRSVDYTFVHKPCYERIIENGKEVDIWPDC